MRPGDILPRRDARNGIFVIVLSNPIHLAAETGRVIVCPYIPGEIPNATMAMVVPVTDPDGVALPELVQWLPISALDEPIGNIGPTALRETTAMVAALIS